MIFKMSNIEKGFERLVLKEFSKLTGVSVARLSEQDGHDLFLDLKDAREDYVYLWFKESGLEDELKDMVEPDEDAIYNLIELSFKKGLTDGCFEINKTFIMTQGYKKALDHLVTYNFNLLKHANTETISSIRKTIAQSVASGEGHPETVKRLTKLDLEPVGHVTPRQRANMISRTEVSRAFNTGNLNAYKSWGVNEIDIITAGDRFVCSYCIEMEETNPHDIGKTEPPLHPNCRCTVAAHITGKLPDKLDKNAYKLANVPKIKR